MFGYSIKHNVTGQFFRERDNSIYISYNKRATEFLVKTLNIQEGYEAWRLIENNGE